MLVVNMRPRSQAHRCCRLLAKGHVGRDLPSAITRQSVPKLEIMLAIPSRIDPSIIGIVDSFLNMHVLCLFACRKGDSEVTITITPIAGTARLQVRGDLETVLPVPFDDDDRFLIGASDGTLLLGTFDEHLNCIWSVAQHGAAIVTICDERVHLEWTVGWVTAAVYDCQMVEGLGGQPLPLFPELDQHAA